MKPPHFVIASKLGSQPYFLLIFIIIFTIRYHLRRKKKRKKENFFQKMEKFLQYRDMY